MIKLEHVITPSPEEMSFVIEGMRNPKNSWNQSDSYKGFDCDLCGHIEKNGSCSSEDKEREHCQDYYGYALGNNDKNLMTKLAKAGTDHRKFLRQMPIMVRITAPLYWWKEFDTYKIGVTANSCSTMHKIQSKEFTLEDFSIEHLDEDVIEYPFKSVIFSLNFFRDLYNKTHDKNDWWQMIQLLPSSYNQTRNVTLNYEVAMNIYKSRRNHKLDEWHDFCDWLTTLPYFKEICIDE